LEVTQQDDRGGDLKQAHREQQAADRAQEAEHGDRAKAGGCQESASGYDASDAIEGMLAKLVAHYAPQKVILFGSYAYGEPDKDSDIDLLVIKDTPERFIDRWVRVHRVLTGTHRSLPLEPVVLTPREVEARLAAGDQFIAEILEKGKVLYGA